MMTELRDILSLAARALVLLFRQPKPRQRRCIYLERRDDDGSDGPFQNLSTPRGTLQMKKVRAQRKR